MKKPEELSPELASIWDELEGQLDKRIGTSGMESLCIQMHRMRDAQERISKEGLVVADAKGNAEAHPAIAVEKQAQAEVRQWVTKFGLRPRA